jgi:glucan phosphoethanolaminetransferase (alkaline phosphatase superfamily)
MPEYEPFTPSALYEVASYSRRIEVSGTYYVAVYNATEGGRYSLAIGYLEEYTVPEWLMVPYDVIGIHLWQGQSLLLILSPLIFVLVVGAGFLVWRWQRGSTAFTLFEWLASVAGLLYIGTGAMIFLQIGIAFAETGPAFSAVLSVVFGLVPILLGVAALYRALWARDTRPIRDRIYIAIIGVLGLFFWAGLLVGPALALIASILPNRFYMR